MTVNQDKDGKGFFAYKITNSINDHAYIGITTSTLQKRWDARIKLSKKGEGPPIAYALRKCGEASFKIEHMACTTNLDDLLELERILIGQENTFLANGCGYNGTLGGKQRDFDRMSVDEREAVKKAKRNMIINLEHRPTKTTERNKKTACTGKTVVRLSLKQEMELKTIAERLGVSIAIMGRRALDE